MPCSTDPDGVLAERYVAGGLTELEQAEYESHYFDCDACHARVRDLQSVRDALAPRAVSAARSRAWMAGLALVATIVAAVAAWRWAQPGELKPGVRPPVVAHDGSAPAASPRDDILALATVTPPPYEPVATRGAADGVAARFAAAMSSYSAGRFAEAADGLAVVNRDVPDLPQAQFYEGVSALLAGRPAEARDALERTAHTGVPPWSDEAHFYLAKAALARADIATARKELATAIERSAGPDGEAARLLHSLDALPR